MLPYLVGSPIVTSVAHSDGAAERPEVKHNSTYGVISVQPPQTPPQLAVHEANRLNTQDIMRIYEMYSPESYARQSSGVRAALVGVGAGALYAGIITGTGMAVKSLLEIGWGIPPVEGPFMLVVGSMGVFFFGMVFLIPALAWGYSVYMDASIRISRHRGRQSTELPENYDGVSQ